MIYTDEMCVALFFYGNRQKTLQQKNVLFKKYDGIENYLKERYPDSSCIEETLFRIKNNLEERPVCKTCHGHLTFNKNNRKFPTYCSSKCSNSDPDKIEKTAQVKFEKYGNRTYNNSRKAAETCKSRYGVTSYAKTSEFANKVKKTSQEKYGCNWFMQTNAFRNKSKQTKALKYGDENYNNRTKAEITTLSKYGVKNTKQAESAKQKEKETCLKKYGVTSYSKTAECKQKHKDTFLKNYGVEHNTQSEKWKEKWYRNEKWVKERNEHIYESMKKNGSFPMSKKESMIYEYIKQEYPDVIREYKDDKRYPFKCDFYIPSIDMFIEYDGHWTHGKHDFNPDDDEDQQVLEKWKSKNNEQYKLAIKVWTKKDPLKRKYAKENNLNYVVLKYDDYKNPQKVIEKIKYGRSEI